MENKKNKGKVLVCGSLVIDSIFDIKGNIRDNINIKEGKLGVQNFSFTSEEKKEFPGGNAGNIAYGLSLLGQKPILASIVGKDFDSKFRKYYESLKINLKLFTEKNGYTATFYGMTDGNKEQIGIFQGNSFSKYNEKISLEKIVPKEKFKNIKIVIVAPQTVKATIKKLEEIKKLGDGKIFTIFDPGQELLSSFGNNPKALKKAICLSKMIIVNEVEAKHIEKILGIEKKNLFSFGIEYFIETLGEKGSVLYSKENFKKILAIKVKKVVDPTGAGDAFRAGLIGGLLDGKNIEESMKIGAKMGALCVQSKGGQGYKLK